MNYSINLIGVYDEMGKAKLIEMLKKKNFIYSSTSYFIYGLKFILEAVLLFIVKCNFKNKLYKIDTIIIPLFHGIGDAIIFTSCLHQIKDFFPEAKITLLTTERTKDILYDTFHDVIFINEINMGELRKFRNQFDLMIFPSRHMKHYLYALSIQPKKIVGYNYSMKIRKKESHIKRANRIAQEFGGSDSVDPCILLSKEHIDNAALLLSKWIQPTKEKYISLIVGGRWRTKIYPNQKYYEIINYLIMNTDFQIVLIGDNNNLGKELEISQKRIINLCGQTTIHQVMGVISLSEIIIGPDGGLINIAMALNRKIIGIFGPVNPETIVSNKYLNQIIFQNKCPYQPCYNEEHEPNCPYSEPLCMQIDTQEIIRRINIVIQIENR